MGDGGTAVRERLKRLREKIQKGDLDEETAKQHIQKLFSATPTRLKRCCCWSCLSIILFTVSLFSLIYCHKPSRQLLKHVVATNSYGVLRRIRLFLVPFIHDGTIDWTKAYDAECIIPNPFFKEEPDDSWNGNGREESSTLFSHIRSVTELEETPNAQEMRKLLEAGHPVVVRHVPGIGDNTYRSLQAFVTSHWENLTEEICEFQTQGEGVKYNFTVEIFQSETDPCNLMSQDEEPWSVSWKHCSQETILGFVPRPEFIASIAEFYNSSYMQCSCPFADHDFESPLPDIGERIVFQLTGVKRIRLHAEQCVECHSFGVTLKAGDMLIYGAQYWQHLGLPQGDGVSVSYGTTFTLVDSNV